MLEYRVYKEKILTFEMVPKGPIPTMYDPDGIYPHESFVETAKRPVRKTYTMVELENDVLKAVFCPDLGGKLFSLKLKSNDREVLYDSIGVKPVRILPRMAFISGGIEVSFPIAHTPNQLERVYYQVEERDGRLYLWMGETEICYGMQWTLEFSLGEKDEFLTQRAAFHNPTPWEHTYTSWSNAAVPAFDDSIISYPNGNVLAHSKELYEMEWQGDKLDSDFHQMHGFFWKTKDCNAFGVFTPRLGTGLYHIADVKEAPGMKLWLYGLGEEERWAYQTSLKKERYIEIQASSIREQAETTSLKPGESTSRTEFWYPAAEKMDIHTLPLPEVALIPAENIPMFAVADREKNRVWKAVISAHKNGTDFDIDRIEDGNWPSVCMPELKEALKGFAEKNEEPQWKYYYALYLLTEEDKNKEQAMELLKAADTAAANAFLGRIYRQQGEYEKSLEAYERITDPTWLMHTQLIIERDMTLEKIDGTADRRWEYLSSVDELTDEYLMERRVNCLIALKRFMEAKELLLSHSFELVHQRYDRTNMWREILQALGEEIPKNIPLSLGEDELATYGAYRVNE